METMTPKEKAEELFNKFACAEVRFDDEEQVMQLAKICVDEIITVSLDVEFEFNQSGNLTGNVNYWKEVKQEIEKL